MNEWRNPYLLTSLLLAAATGLRDALRGSTLVHLALAMGLVLAAAWIMWRHLQRPGLALLAAATTTLWLFVQAPREELLAASFIPAGLLLFTPARKLPGAAIAAATAFVVALIVVPGGPYPLLVAPALAAAFSLARPQQPTQDTLDTLRTACLYLPAGGLALTLAWNGASGFGAHYPALDALTFGLGLLLLLSLVTLGALGLLTLIETTDRLQAHTWNAYAIVAATVVAGALALRDASATLELLVLVAPTTAVLSTIVLARIRHALHGRPRPRPLPEAP